MISVMYLILSLSLSASIIAVLLLVLRPILRDRLSKSWQYYIWLVVMLRLLVPLAPETNLMGAVFGAVERQSAAHGTQYTQIAGEAIAGDRGPDNAVPGVQAEPTGQADTPDTAAPAAQPLPWQQLTDNLWLFWFIPALVLFVRSVTSYNSFLRYIRSGREEVGSEQVLTAYQRACEDVDMRRPLPVYQNKLAASPMLVGVLRPSIILPELDMDVDSMQLVLRHELVHHRRRDLIYKWLVQVAVCIHWFNPLVYRIRREIDKNCELSCDEQVVSKMPAEEKVRYGDTLLASIKTGGDYSSAVASVTLSEDGANLKERLAAILKCRPGTWGTRAIAVVCSLFIICCASFSGAYFGFAAARGNSLSDSGELRVFTEAQSEPVVSWQPDLPAGPAESASDRISHVVEDAIDPYRIKDWAKRWAASWRVEQAEYWKNYAERWAQYSADYWNDYADQWSGNFSGDSWMNLSYAYEDGYLVGVGLKHNDKLEEYPRAATVTANGKTCTIAFSSGYESFADDGKVMELVQQILTDNTGGSWRSAEYYAVRSVYNSNDREALLRQLYSERAFVEFMELVEHCRGLGVVEELLYIAADDGESMYFMFLAEQLPADFSDGETLARKAVEMGDIIMLDEMEPFISGALYESLLKELLQLPD